MASRSRHQQFAVTAAFTVKQWCVLQIGYWRYISIYRHLQRNPDNQLYPLFEYFENWCQDENRHGDFFSAILKSQPQVLHLEVLISIEAVTKLS